MRDRIRSRGTMKRTILLAGAFFLLAGCSTVYVKAGKSAEDFEKDREACEVVAKKELAARGASLT
jgi:uncharacterized lipoprotein